MTDGSTPDGLLLRRYRERGDEAAFAELRSRHLRLVLATCRREIGDATLAEDSAQAAFLLLTRKAFADDASLAGWLYGAARLVSKNVVREEARRRRRERRAYEEFEAPERAWEAVSPHVDAALEGLKPADREAILLRFAGDLSLAEVGRAMGVEENAARMRVARALERMRTYLRRAGVGVTAILLASLLSTRLADAELSIIGRPSARAIRLARRASWMLPLALAWKPASLAIVVLGAGGIALRVAATGSPRLTPAESNAVLESSAGAWRGTLEFADDASGRRTKTATTVTVDRPGGGLRLIARYPSFRNVDATTFRPLADGRFAITTGGAGSSHRLDGAYELVRLRDGKQAFVGFSPAVRSEVRLRLGATGDTLTLEEDVLRDGAYRLRNRFELQRAP